MNEPQLFGLAVMSAGLAWFWKRRADGRAVEPAVLVMVLAGYDVVVPFIGAFQPAVGAGGFYEIWMMRDA